MSNSIVTDRPFSTNGVTFPAGTISTSDVKSAVRGPRGGVLSDEDANSVLHDLQRRQAAHNAYMRGINEKHTYTHDAGSMAVGSGGE